MWVVSVLGAVLGIGNAIWAYWRWRRDSAYVAWSISVNQDEDDAQHPTVRAVNSGSAAAYAVQLLVVREPGPTGLPQGIGGALDVQPQQHVQGLVTVDGTTHSFPKIIVRWSRRPGEKLQTTELVNGVQRKPVRSWRHRLAKRLTG